MNPHAARGLHILTWPDPRLDKVAEEVPHGERVRETVEAMVMYLTRTTNGIGLAAPQLGIMKRIIVCRVPVTHGGATHIVRHTIINPVMTWHDEGPMELGWEGCLSFPDKQVQIPRWRRITVRGYDLRWEPKAINAKGLVARALQHEMDHLDGRNLAYYARVAYEEDQARQKEAEQQIELPLEAKQ